MQLFISFLPWMLIDFVYCQTQESCITFKSFFLNFRVLQYEKFGISFELFLSVGHSMFCTKCQKLIKSFPSSCDSLEFWEITRCISNIRSTYVKTYVRKVSYPCYYCFVFPHPAIDNEPLCNVKQIFAKRNEKLLQKVRNQR